LDVPAVLDNQLLSHNIPMIINLVAAVPILQAGGVYVSYRAKKNVHKIASQ
jgi:hypothetical protein